MPLHWDSGTKISGGHGILRSKPGSSIKISLIQMVNSVVGILSLIQISYGCELEFHGSTINHISLKLMTERSESDPM